MSATLTALSAILVATQWTSRLLAEHLKIRFCAVPKARREYGVQPWRSETFKFSTGPESVAKVIDVVALYLELPANVIVLSVDEKSQVQAHDRTQPTLPMQPGLREHHYARHGTAT